jgi:hypothetical protein
MRFTVKSRNILLAPSLYIDIRYTGAPFVDLSPFTVRMDDHMNLGNVSQLTSSPTDAELSVIASIHAVG